MGNCCAAGLVNCLAGLVLWTGKGMWILAKLGFTVTGIAVGSLAAMAMACFGNVQAGNYRRGLQVQPQPQKLKMGAE
ncbi:hypothetical protein MSG28_001917 [Choristoneura fumiferana]|uniref:Uncharacterized protein n=1 Tax=Choristoneura fumiferana TaxID=7141 RepID=A0ACC0JT94_CHOFU|nr:hypothetical protein MSG28_001917 [Choristoneura fumiferana]